MKKVKSIEVPDHFICQKWEEVELGWGERPDGYSLHVNEKSLRSWIRESKERQRYSMEYSVPCGKSYLVPTKLFSKADIKKVMGSYDGGAKFYGFRKRKYPPGDTDGWMERK